MKLLFCRKKKEIHLEIKYISECKMIDKRVYRNVLKEINF